MKGRKEEVRRGERDNYNTTETDGKVWRWNKKRKERLKEKKKHGQRSGTEKTKSKTCFKLMVLGHSCACT